VITYYGRFPVSHFGNPSESVQRQRRAQRKTFARRGGLIRIAVGSETTVQDLADDWMMTHDMVHLNISGRPRTAITDRGRHRHLRRAHRANSSCQVDAKSMWADLVRDMPKGLPGPGDEGLDAHIPGLRTYWGGALFCFNGRYLESA